MPDTGWHSSTTETEVDQGGDSSNWHSESNTRDQDNQYGFCHLEKGLGPTWILKTHGYDMDVPEGATIVGIRVIIERWCEYTGVDPASVNDSSIRLMKNLTPVGNNRASASRIAGEAQAHYGPDGGDMWGTTWSVEEVNHANFGVAIVMHIYEGGTMSIPQIDWVPIRIWYTLGFESIEKINNISIGDLEKINIFETADLEKINVIA